MEQPFFRVQSVSTNIKLKDGETVLCGGGFPTSDDKEKVGYLFVTARIVDGCVNPLHAKVQTPVATTKK